MVVLVVPFSSPPSSGCGEMRSEKVWRFRLTLMMNFPVLLVAVSHDTTIALLRSQVVRLFGFVVLPLTVVVGGGGLEVGVLVPSVVAAVIVDRAVMTGATAVGVGVWVGIGVGNVVRKHTGLV